MKSWRSATPKSASLRRRLKCCSRCYRKRSRAARSSICRIGGSVMLRRVDMIRSLQLARQAYDDVCEQRDAYKRELELTMQQLAELRDEVAELRAAVLAKHKADDALAKLYRERAITCAQAAERDPNAMLN